MSAATVRPLAAAVAGAMTPTARHAPAAASSGLGGTRAPRNAAERFAALLDAPAQSSSTRLAASTPTRAEDDDHRFAAAAGDAGAECPASAASATSASSPRPEHADSPTAAAACPACSDEIEGLLDTVAELVLAHPASSAAHWSVTVWLRPAVLRETRLHVAGEPGAVDVHFASTDPESLRRLHAGRDDLQARLRERIAALGVHITIEAAAANDRFDASGAA
jgi:Type III secretion protein (HpaP)